MVIRSFILSLSLFITEMTITPFSAYSSAPQEELGYEKPHFVHFSPLNLPELPVWQERALRMRGMSGDGCALFGEVYEFSLLNIPKSTSKPYIQTQEWQHIFEDGIKINALNNDGTVAVGYRHKSPNNIPYMWLKDKGIIEFSKHALKVFQKGKLNAVSACGTVAGGLAKNIDDAEQAFIYIEGIGGQFIGPMLTSPCDYSVINTITRTPENEIIAGGNIKKQGVYSWHAFMWSNKSGITLLPSLNKDKSFINDSCTKLSRNGRVFLGMSHAMRVKWINETVRPVECLQTQGIQILADINGDGTIIAGNHMWSSIKDKQGHNGCGPFLEIDGKPHFLMHILQENFPQEDGDLSSFMKTYQIRAMSEDATHFFMVSEGVDVYGTRITNNKAVVLSIPQDIILSLKR